MNVPVKMDHHNLVNTQYSQSLITEGLRSGLINPDTTQAIPLRLLDVFKEVMYRYTLGESNTLRIETAESLMESIVFTIDLYLLNHTLPEEALEILQNPNLDPLYRQALEYLKEYTQEIHELYKQVESERLYIPNALYLDTFTKAIPKFFEVYDFYYGAHEAAGGDIDYQLLWNHSESLGVVYIRDFLQQFRMENQFCSNFLAVDITALLKAYGRARQTNYELAVINLVELILGNVLFLTLLEKDYSPLFLSTIELEVLETRFIQMKALQVEALLQSTIDQMIERLNITNPQLINLLNTHGNNFIQRMLQSFPDIDLKNLVITAPTQISHSHVIDLGQKIDNKAFKLIYESIQACTDVKEKVLIINEKVSSFEDFIDLLKADCFWDDEYEALYASLDMQTVSILISHGLRGYFLDQDAPVSQLLHQPPSLQETWEQHLANWLATLEKDQITLLQDLVRHNVSSEIV